MVIRQRIAGDRMTDMGVSSGLTGNASTRARIGICRAVLVSRGGLVERDGLFIEAFSRF